MTVMVTARFENGKVEQQVTEAIAMYRQRLNLLPAAVIVNPQVQDEAATALRKLGLRLPVEGVGGCLLNEVWLRVSEASHENS